MSTYSNTQIPTVPREEHHPRAQRQNVGKQERRWTGAAGAGLLLLGFNSHRAPWNWLTAGAGGMLLYRAWSGYCPVYERAGLNTAVRHVHQGGVPAGHGTRITRSIHINRSREELYQLWRDLEHLPELMRHVSAITVIDEKRSLWTAVGPRGIELEWEAEIINDRAPELIAWQSLPGSPVKTAGSVQFRTVPFGSGTEVRVSLKYDPPGGAATERLAHLFGQGLEDDLTEDLRRLKQQLETGETPRNAPSPRDGNHY